MKIPFSKYHGTGNDFILIDNRTLGLKRWNPNLYAQWCHRRFGIGADGVILVQHHADTDFEMVYFNADGKESSMCGNGGRCVVAFAQRMGVIQENDTTFMAIDGIHEAKIQGSKQVSLKMSDVEEVELFGQDFVLNTGSPHYIKFVEDLQAIQVFEEGRAIRNQADFVKEGINVNFVKRKSQDAIEVATYERGVEAETFSCGTGVVAASIATSINNIEEGKQQTVGIQTKGGELSVQFEKNKEGFSNIWLMGPTAHVFDGFLRI